MLVEVDLVRQLKEKDIAAFGQLYDCYAPALYGLIFKLTPDSKIATTILENSFLKCWLQIGLFDAGKDKLFMWMVQITITQCKDVLKLQDGVILQELQLKTPFHNGAKPD
jgi:RNA polymerase sigma-70 factor (ECF subfamily)